MKISQFLFGDVRKAVTLDEPIMGTVPLQHGSNIGTEYIRRLPVVRKCLGYIADMINEAEPILINKKGVEIERGIDNMPSWIQNPSGEYVLAEWVQQGVWSAFANGSVRNLAQVRPGRTEPTYMYIGTSSLLNLSYGGHVIYKDISQTSTGDDLVIVANKVSVRRRFAVPGQTIGLGELEPAKTLINTALYAQDVLDKFFGNNMFFDVIFMHDGEYVEGQAKELITKLARRHAGASRAFRPIVSDHKWKMERMKDSNQANQMLELLGFINTSISTLVFGIDPLVFSLSTASHASTNLTYQNASNLRSASWLQACSPIAAMLEGCISDYLPRGTRLKFSPSGMLRGSPNDRAGLVANMALAGKHYGSPVFEKQEMREVLGYSGEGPEIESVPEPDPMPIEPVPEEQVEPEPEE